MPYFQKQLKTLTLFEQEVLAALEQVPAGKVTTYQLLAQAVNRPRAVRAVGNALRKNPWAPAIPCHRVVTSDGFIGGYVGGAAKKVKLLTAEGVRIGRGWRVGNFAKHLHTF